MASRLELHNEFVNILGSQLEKDKRVYFNSPESKGMTYPCIRYSRAAPALKRANDIIYNNQPRYEGMVIDADPDSTIPDTLLERFKYCSIGKSFVSDNLIHTPFTIYY